MRSPSSAAIAAVATHEAGHEAHKQQQTCARVAAPVGRWNSFQTDQEENQQNECKNP
jgi:hypothetical protein